MIALSLNPPYAEQILSGTKRIEYRTVPTHKRERVWVYETKREGGRGLIVGSVEIFGCERHDMNYEWALRFPKRCRPWRPSTQPQPVFFNPRRVTRDE